MTLADQIRAIDFDVPAPAVAERLGCRKEYVRAVRARTRRPEHYNELAKKSQARQVAKDPEGFRRRASIRAAAWYQNNRERALEYSRAYKAKNKARLNEYYRKYYHRKKAEAAE